MQINEIVTPSFRSARKPYKPMVQPTADSDFCNETVAKGRLTQEQMDRAAERYRLGRSKSGRTIFWMMDELGRVRDGHIGDSWVSTMLRAREPELLRNFRPAHCLFGLHLLEDTTRPVGIVEKETTAVVMSELYPTCHWLATGNGQLLSIDLLEPLRAYGVTLFPATDPTMETYMAWLETANQARRAYRLDISVSAVLEDHTTAEQKERRMDLADFVFESR